ncbi:U3 small nucleolar RNA-associated protein 4 [Tanacetum coccineum]|uniref:U3 small nucleolar RNA-associated protein 4 n=1 Tax=Tanacetum coccineum TaxID=301880 RepID=A0ABQ5AB68_9ASTR
MELMRYTSSGLDMQKVEADSLELYEEPITETTSIAIVCDDSCVRIYSISDPDGFTYHKTLPRVSGCVLSVTWSLDWKMIYSGSSDGCGTLVSADSSGSVELWDSLHGTLLQAHSYHKGDVTALAASPSDTRVFSAGCDGQDCPRGYLVSGSSDYTVRLWDHTSGLLFHTCEVRSQERQKKQKIMDSHQAERDRTGIGFQIICLQHIMFLGYLYNPGATKLKIDKQGFVHTGDLWYIDDDDQLFIVDRIKELIKYKGFQDKAASFSSLKLFHAIKCLRVSLKGPMCPKKYRAGIAQYMKLAVSMDLAFSFYRSTGQ